MDEYEENEELIATAKRLAEEMAQGNDDLVNYEISQLPVEYQRKLLVVALCLI